MLTKMNMTLQTLKDDINKTGFSQEARDLINAILDKAIKRGSNNLEKDERDEISAIMDLEIKGTKLEADAKKQTAAALNEFADGIEGAISQALDELEALEKEPDSGAPAKP